MHSRQIDQNDMKYKKLKDILKVKIWERDGKVKNFSKINEYSRLLVSL